MNDATLRIPSEILAAVNAVRARLDNAVALVAQLQDAAPHLDVATQMSPELVAQSRDVARQLNAMATQMSPELVAQSRDAARQLNAMATQMSPELVAQSRDAAELVAQWQDAARPQLDAIATQMSPELVAQLRDAARQANAVATQMSAQFLAQLQDTARLQPNTWAAPLLEPVPVPRSYVKADAAELAELAANVAELHDEVRSLRSAMVDHQCDIGWETRQRIVNIEFCLARLLAFIESSPNDELDD